MNNSSSIKFILLFCIVILVNSQVFSQWQQTNGIKGGYFSQVAGDDENILAVTNYGSIYNYKNGEWSFRSSYTYFNDIFMLGDKWIGYSSNSISLSEDDGLTWQEILKPENSNFIVQAEVIDGNIYALSSDTLYLSTDAGYTWHTNKFNSMVYVEIDGQLDSGFIYGLNSFYVKDSVMLAAAFTTLPFSFDAVLYSTDLGQNWQLTNFPESSSSSFGLEITADESTYYTATTNGFFKSVNGLDWIEINEGLQVGDNVSFSISNIDVYNGELLAVINNTPSGLYRYKNNSWEKFYDESLPSYLSTENGNLLMCANGAVEQFDGYATWNNLTEDLIASTSKPVTSTNGNVYSLYNKSIYRTTDRGVEWNIVLENATTSFVVEEDKIFSTTASGVIRSLNNGIDWTIVNDGIPSSYIPKLRALGIADNKLFAGFYGINSFPRGSWGEGGIYVSTNDGYSWSSFNSGLPTQYSVPVPVYTITAKDNIIILYTTEGRYSLINDTWVNIDNGFPTDTYISSIVIFNENIIFLTNSGLFISYDKGVTKQEFSNGFPDWLYYYTSIFVYDETLYAISSEENTAVYKLTGDQWNEVDFPMPENVRFSSFEAGGANLYAGTYDNGIWRYDPTPSGNNDVAQNVFSYKLNQNYPNPFNPTTKIKYSIPNVGTSFMKFVQLKVYDVIGNEIATLVNEQKPAGEYEIEFDASNLPSGVYFYQIKAGSFVETKKMILLR